MKRIVLLKNQSQYGALRLHIDCMAKAASKMGYPVDVYDLADQQQLADLPNLLAGDNYFVFSFVGSNFRAGGKTIGEMANAPHVIMIVDQPSHHLDRLKGAAPDQIIAFIDTTHVPMVHDFVPNIVADTTMLPPGASTPDECEIEQSVEDFVKNRHIPILFTGSCYDPKSRPWAGQSDTPVGKILDATVEIAMGGNEVPLQDAMKQAITQLFAAHVVDETYPKLAPFFGPINNVVHGRRRWNTLQSLAKAKIPLHLYGNGWEKHMYRFKSFTYGGIGSMKETFELLKKTKICLNSNTNFIGGAHERVFMAQSSGAAVVSDSSSWYRSEYTDGEDIALYSWVGSPDVVERVQMLLDDTDRLYSIAKAGHKKAKENHSWESRLNTIFGLVDTKLAKAA